MNRLVSRSLVAALVLCLAFAGAALADQGTTPKPMTTSLWGLICGTWSSLSKLWQEEGSSLDPFGDPPATATSDSDAGSSLDPFGTP